MRFLRFVIDSDYRCKIVKYSHIERSILEIEITRNEYLVRTIEANS